MEIVPIKIRNVNQDNVDEFVPLAEKSDVFAKYYSPSCGHCTAMEKDWNQMTEHFKDKKSKKELIIASIDPYALEALKKSKIFSKVNGFPSIHYLCNGQPKHTYNGNRSKDDMIQWLNGKLLQEGGSKKKSQKNKGKKTQKSQKNKSKKAKKAKKAQKNKTKKVNQSSNMHLNKKDYKKLLSYYKVGYNSNYKEKVEELMANKLCRCIKRVDPKKRNEKRAITICNNSIFSKKNLSHGHFTCKKNGKLKKTSKGYTLKKTKKHLTLGKKK